MNITLFEWFIESEEYCTIWDRRYKRVLGDKQYTFERVCFQTITNARFESLNVFGHYYFVSIGIVYNNIHWTWRLQSLAVTLLSNKSNPDPLIPCNFQHGINLVRESTMPILTSNADPHNRLFIWFGGRFSTKRNRDTFYVNKISPWHH